MSINGSQTPLAAKPGYEPNPQARCSFDGTIIKLVKEYVLSMNVSLVKSSPNKADRLTRVPQNWLDAMKRNTEPVQPAWTASLSLVGLDQIKIVHRQSGYPGVWWTLYFVKQIAPGVSEAAVKTVIRECEVPVDRSSTRALVEGGFEC